MNSKSLVSVIIPVYNASKFIEQTIHSVLNQTYTNIEIILVDDKSTDNSVDIVKNMNIKNLTIVELLTNNGNPAIPRNKGIEISSGEYIAFLDADDLWKPTKIEKQVNLMEETGMFFCYTDYDCIDTNNKYLSTYHTKHNNGFVFNKMLSWYEVGNLTVVINKEILKEIKKPYFNTNIKYSQDHNLFMRLLARNDACSVKEVLAEYRVHENSLTQNTSEIQWENQLYTGLELKSKYTDLYKRYKLDFKHYFKVACKKKADFLIKIGQLRKAQHYLKKATVLGERHKKRYEMSLKKDGLKLLQEELKRVDG